MILSSRFEVVYNKSSDGASFSWSEGRITIGVKSVNKDPTYTFSVISHEVMEVILVGMGARFASTRTGENYLFSFDHQTFENAIQIHAQVLTSFI